MTFNYQPYGTIYTTSSFYHSVCCTCVWVSTCMTIECQKDISPTIIELVAKIVNRVSNIDENF